MRIVIDVTEWCRSLLFSLVAAQKFLYLIYLNTESFASVAATSAINFFFWAWPNRISV